MKLNSAAPTSTYRALALGLILTLTACPILALDQKKEEVYDWVDDEVSIHIAVSGRAAGEGQEVRDEDQGELTLLGIEWGRSGDFDTFSFVLPLRATVRLESHGEADTWALLLNEAGLDVASDDDGGVATNFRIVKTLAPGRYVLGVRTAGAPAGPYVLAACLSRPQGAAD